LSEYATSSVSATACNATVSWNSKDVAAMKYEIERKGPGEMAYLKVGEVNPFAGTVLANNSYTFANVLSNVPAGTVSFRIRQVIDTASATFAAVYIDTASFILGTACTTTSTNDPGRGDETIIVQPNPTSGQTNLVIESRTALAELSIRIFDMKGRLVLQLQRSKGPGRSAIPIDLDLLANGKYLISVYNKQLLIGTADLLKL
jgi:hypothetical protein